MYLTEADHSALRAVLEVLDGLDERTDNPALARMWRNLTADIRAAQCDDAAVAS